MRTRLGRERGKINRRIEQKRLFLQIWLEMPELGAVGFAELVANEACPEIADGPGQVVTATFAHGSAQVLDLVFEPMDAWTADSRILASPETRQAFQSTTEHDSHGSSLTLGVTAAHPFWSMTRDEFVPAGEMELGEQVVALEGQLWRLTSITSRAGPESVYNLEVAGEHVYYVGGDGLLVHNVYISEYVYLIKNKAGRVVYVGITNSPKVRKAQHIGSGIMKSTDTMIVISKKIAHPRARTLESQTIYNLLNKALRSGKANRGDQIWKQLADAGLRNSNRGRIKGRWVETDVMQFLLPLSKQWKVL